MTFRHPLALKLAFQGLKITVNTKAAKNARRALVPSGPTIGKSCLANDAPDWIVIMAKSTASMASKKRRFTMYCSFKELKQDYICSEVEMLVDKRENSKN